MYVCTYSTQCSGRVGFIPTLYCTYNTCKNDAVLVNEGGPWRGVGGCVQSSNNL